MTALAMERSSPKMDASGAAGPPDKLNMALAANAIVWQQGIACFQPSSGYAVDASATTGLWCVGIWEKSANNTGGANGAINVNAIQGTFKLLSGTGVDLITQADAGSIAWLIDDQTFGLTNGGGTRSPAGIITQVDSDGGVWVAMSLQIAAMLALIVGNGPASMSARAVATSLAAYGGTTTGTLTASANGALGSQDGVAVVAGDVIWVPEGITNLSAASDAGPYLVVNAGSAGTKFVLTRPSWWLTGAAIPNHPVDVGGEGTFWAGTQWKSFAAKGATVDSSAPKLYPGRVSQSLTLVAGTKTFTTVPVLSAASAVAITRTAPSGTASTIAYAVNGAPTPGVIGTGSITVFATVAAGTVNASDVSTVTVVVINW